MARKTFTSVSHRSARLQLVQLPEPSGDESLAIAVRNGLESCPKTLPCRFFYDAVGSELFEQICDLPEYYLTRTEDAILAESADQMVAGWVSDPVMVELGSGSSTKTRRLIRAALHAYGRLRYIPIDVSRSILEASARSLVAEFPKLRVQAIAGTYHAALATLAARIERPKLFVFLGSSLGNFTAEEAGEFLREIASSMRPVDRLLLGTDLVKERAILEAAYDDSQRVTAAFNLNLLTRINRELHADFQPESFEHKAIYREDLHRVEMHLVSRVDQQVSIGDLGLEVNFSAGESIHTENSHKYTLDRLGELARSAGLVEELAWTDGDGHFRVQRWMLGD